jgi:hypothetical protein
MSVKTDVQKVQAQIDADSRENSGLRQQQAAIGGASLKEPGHLRGRCTMNAESVAAENAAEDKARATVPKVP